MHEIHPGRLTVTFTHRTNTFDLTLTDDIYYINSLCQPDVGKT